jgi:hypothetical protein
LSQQVPSASITATSRSTQPVWCHTGLTWLAPSRPSGPTSGAPEPIGQLSRQHHPGVPKDPSSSGSSPVPTKQSMEGSGTTLQPRDHGWIGDSVSPNLINERIPSDVRAERKFLNSAYIILLISFSATMLLRIRVHSLADKPGLVEGTMFVAVASQRQSRVAAVQPSPSCWSPRPWAPCGGLRRWTSRPTQRPAQPWDRQHEAPVCRLACDARGLVGWTDRAGVPGQLPHPKAAQTLDRFPCNHAVAAGRPD